MNPYLRYLLCLSLVSPVELVFTAIFFTTTDTQYSPWPGVYANIFFFLILGNIGGWRILRPIRAYYKRSGSYKAAQVRVLNLPMISAIWVSVLVLPFGYVKFWLIPALYQWENGPHMAFDQCVTITTVYSIFFGFLVFFFMNMLRSHQTPAVFERYHLSMTGVKGRFAIRLAVVVAVTCLLPQWVLMSEAYTMGVGMERSTLLQAALSSLLATILGVILVAYSFAQPVSELMRGVNRVLKGDSDVRLPVWSFDEFGGLTSSFNDMVDRLRERMFEREVTGRMISREVSARAMNGPQAQTSGLGLNVTQVTVVHMRVADHGALRDVDPEQRLGLINGVWQAVTEVASRYGGGFMNPTGSDAVATFNYPRASLDHAEAAISFVTAANVAVKEFRLAHPEMGYFQLSFGVSTGDVLAGQVRAESLTGNILFGAVRTIAEDYSRKAMLRQVPALIAQSTVDAAGARAPVKYVGAEEDAAVHGTAADEAGVYALAS